MQEAVPEWPLLILPRPKRLLLCDDGIGIWSFNRPEGGVHNVSSGVLINNSSRIKGCGQRT